MADLVDTRLRDARPATADVDPDALDAELLRRVSSQPVRRRSARRPALVAAAAAAVVVVAALVLAPGPATAPTAQAAVRQAMRWFDPPAGSIVHYRNVIRSPDAAGPPLTQEVWQSVDRPEQMRRSESSGGVTAEVADGAIFDPRTNTIHRDVPLPEAERREVMRRALERKYEAAKRAGASAADLRRMRADFRKAMRRPDEPAGTVEPAGDSVVAGIRRELERGHARLGAETTHDGVAALPITLEPGPRGDAQPRWTLWTAADDGRPLELRIDSGPGTRVEGTITWTTYEVLPSAEAPLTLEAAHPTADVVRDHDAYEAAGTRLFPRG